MNRQQRRGLEADASKATGEAIPSAEGIVRYLVARMAQRGTTLVAELRREVDGEPNSGHTVSALMNEAARLEEALVRGRFADAADAAVCVLFFARDIAIREGKIKVEKIAQA